VIGFLGVFSNTDVHAGTVFGPIKPYESFNDSPFKGLPFSYFHLETFEEDALTAPGVTASAGTVVGPGFEVDSVDGGGYNGHSFFSADGAAGIKFTFDATVLGYLPTHAAIAWTDGDGGNRTFQAWDSPGNLIGNINDPSPHFFSQGDGDRPTTASLERSIPVAFRPSSSATPPVGLKLITFSTASSHPLFPNPVRSS
jgi:hypothetical protein